MSEPVVTTLYAQLIDHLGMPASERVAFDAHSDPGGYVFTPVKDLQLKATTGGVVEIQFFRTMEATDPVMMRPTPGLIGAGNTMTLSPLFGQAQTSAPTAGPTPDEIDRVAKALFDAFRGDACPQDTWVDDKWMGHKKGLTLQIDGDVDLTKLAIAAIKAVRGLEGKGG